MVTNPLPVAGPEPAPTLPWIPILLYHRVVPVPPRVDSFGNCTSVAVFASHLAWLARRGFTPMPLSTLELFAYRGDRPGIKLPARPVVLTFDDGYQDNYRYAWPLLQRYGFTATIFVVTNTIGGDNDFDLLEGEDQASMLSAAQIRELHRHRIEIGSHTCSHPASLLNLTDQQLMEELSHSKAALEELVAAPVEHFSYPHSKLDHHVEAAVARSGYRLACAGVGTRFDPFSLQRVAPPKQGGARIELHMQWRRLKWLRRSRHPSGDSNQGRKA